MFNLKGGIAAWQGQKAAGPAEMGMMLLEGDETPLEVIAAAYGLEEGLRKFYATSTRSATDPEVAGILAKLAEIEVRHKQRLYDLYLTFDTGAADIKAFEARALSDLVEGGFDPDKLLEQSSPAFETTVGVLNFAMMLEAQAMDLYMRYAQKIEDPGAKQSLYKMADEEKAHLKSLGDLLEKTTGG